MTKKNIFNYFIIYVIGFLSFFYNFDVKIDKNYNNSYFKFFIFNKVYAEESDEEDNYEYEVSESAGFVSRKNKKDKDYKETSKDTQTAMRVISWIPGIGPLIQSFTYLIEGAILEDLNLGKIFGIFTGDTSGLFEAAGAIENILNATKNESSATIALDSIYATNLYCRYQNIYEEETDLVHRSGHATRGGLEHSIFPIYPLDIKVNDSTGLCDISASNIVENNFIRIHDVPGGAFESPKKTKCSYSYTAASEQCVKDLTSPILIAFEIEDLAASIACAIASFTAARKAAEKAAKKAAKKAAEEAAKKALKEAGEEVTEEAIEKIRKEAMDRIYGELKDKVTDEILDKAADQAEAAAREAAEKAAKEAAKKTEGKVSTLIGKSVGSVSRSTLGYFTDTRLIYDPVSLLAVLDGQLAFEFLGALFEGLKTPPMLPGCIGGTVAALAAFNITAKSVILGMSRKAYEKAKDAITNYTFCGYDWFTYAKTPDEKYYTKGINPHSYYKKVYDCINKVADADGGECGAISDEDICTDGTPFCLKNNKMIMSKYTKDIKNKIFREYVFGGKEYQAGPIEKNITKSNDNRKVLFNSGDSYNPDYCIDPRTPEQKGFQSIYQRYYMRGNDKANFACGRFYYDGKSSCILHKNQISAADEWAMKKAKEDGDYYLLKDGDEYKEVRNKYTKQCQEAFLEARKCCKYRSRHFICLENKSTKNSTFCFSNVVEEYSNENSQIPNNLIWMLQNVQNDGDFFKYTCELDKIKFEATKKHGTNHICVFSYGLCPYDFKLNAGLNYRATYCDANYLDETLDAKNTIRRGNTHFNADDCKKGIFSADEREEYKSKSTSSKRFASYAFNSIFNDMGCNEEYCPYNEYDFKTIYDYDKIKTIVNKVKAISTEGNTNQRDLNKVKEQLDSTEMRMIQELCDPTIKDDCNNQLTNMFSKGFSGYTDGTDKVVFRQNLSAYLANNLRTSAYGKVKNFCQYRAHCVEVDEERELEEFYDGTPLFLDSSCTGTTNNSRNILPGAVVGLPRQLSAPIVECVHESLKNLVNGIVGNSYCTEDYDLNNEGFCGSDTAEMVKEAIENKNANFFKDKYLTLKDEIENRTFYIIKGQKLPTSYNPFLMLQKRFISITKAALTLFLVLYFYKLFLTGKIGDFTKTENMAKLVFNLFKFSVIIWLVFYNGWQDGVYSRLVNFSSGAFNFVNSIFIKVINNPNNQMLSFGDNKKQLTLERYDDLTGEEDKVFGGICYRYDILNNIKYETISDITGYCSDGYKMVAKDKIFVEKKDDKRRQENGELIISTNQEMAKLIAFIDEYNEKNSYKLRVYRMVDGKSFDLSGDDSPKKEDLYGTSEKQAIMNYNKNYITNYDRTNVWSKYYDGCYFDTTEYKEGKSYLALFDTLDCKFMRYLGYSTDKMVPNLLTFSAMMIVPNYLFQGLEKGGAEIITKVVNKIGAVLFGFVMSFVFVMFNALIKTLYVFLSSFFTLSILIFVSPIVLPLVFYERTKKMVNTWMDLIVDSVMRPAFNLTLMVLYINIMDIILLKNVMFIKHDWRGRGANTNCYLGSASSFVCLVNNLLGGISPDEIRALFNDGLFSFLLDMLLVILLFTLSDSMIQMIDGIIKQIFNFMSDSGKSGASVMGLSGGNSVADSEGKSTEEVLFGRRTPGGKGREGGAMGAGKSIEAFRGNYLTKTPGAMLDGFIKKTTNDGKSVKLKDMEFGKIKINSYDNAGVKIAKGLTKFNEFVGKPYARLSSGISYIGAGANLLREKADNLNDKVRGLTSRIARINAKRGVDNLKSGFKGIKDKIKNGIDYKTGKLDKEIETNRAKIDSLKEKQEKLKQNLANDSAWLKNRHEKKIRENEKEIKKLEEIVVENEKKKKTKVTFGKNRFDLPDRLMSLNKKKQQLEEVDLKIEETKDKLEYLDEDGFKIFRKTRKKFNKWKKNRLERKAPERKEKLEKKIKDKEDYIEKNYPDEDDEDEKDDKNNENDKKKEVVVRPENNKQKYSKKDGKTDNKEGEDDNNDTEVDDVDEGEVGEDKA